MPYSICSVDYKPPMHTIHTMYSHCCQKSKFCKWSILHNQNSDDSDILLYYVLPSLSSTIIQHILYSLHCNTPPSIWLTSYDLSNEVETSSAPTVSLRNLLPLTSITSMSCIQRNTIHRCTIFAPLANLEQRIVMMSKAMVLHCIVDFTSYAGMSLV